MKLRVPTDRKDGQKDLLKLAATLASPSPASTDYGQWIRIPYQPKPLCSRKFILSDETQGAISDLEITASKYDCLIGSSPYSATITQLLHRMEGVYAALLNGIQADYRLCCYLDFFSVPRFDATKPADPKETLQKNLDANPLAIRASQCAFQVKAIVDGIFRGDLEFKALTPSRIVTLHDSIAITMHPNHALGLRTEECAPQTAEGVSGIAYLPPPPDQLPAFLEDISTFLAVSKLSPSTKAALVYFQMEAVSMFSTNLDGIARLLSACLWKNVGLVNLAMPPISITPAIYPRTHDEKVKAYLSNPNSCEMLLLDEWIYLTTCSTRNALEIERLCYLEAKRLVDSWRQRLSVGASKMTKTMQRYLIEMIGTPVFSIASMAASIDASFSTTERITSLLLEQKIIVQTTKGKRNRIYECPEAVGMFNWADETFRNAE